MGGVVVTGESVPEKLKPASRNRVTCGIVNRIRTMRHTKKTLMSRKTLTCQSRGTVPASRVKTSIQADRTNTIHKLRHQRQFLSHVSPNVSNIFPEEFASLVLFCLNMAENTATITIHGRKRRI